MSVLTFPSVPIADCKWGLITNTQSMQSELNGAIQTAGLPGDHWKAEITISDLVGREGKELTAFFTRLRGRAGRFYFTPPAGNTPEGSAMGSGVVSGAGQTGTSLVTTGWTPDQPELLAVGDYFQVGYELKQVVVTASSDALGNATIQFAPPIRTSPANAAPIVTASPTCVMMLDDDKQSSAGISGPRIYAISFACREALDI